MGKLESTNIIRKIEKTRKDYVAYVNCFCMTGYSDRVGERSYQIRNAYLIGQVPSFDFFCKNFDRLWRNNRKFIEVYEDEYGQIIAMAKFEKLDEILYIDRFIVMREYQLCGYGSSFYHAIEQRARKDGFQEIWLYCMFEGSRVFWFKMGFVDCGRFVKDLKEHTPH